MGRVARRRRLGLGCSRPRHEAWRRGPDLEGSRIVASSTPVRISVPSTEAPGDPPEMSIRLVDRRIEIEVESEAESG
jgi:hypothetical protein